MRRLSWNLRIVIGLIALVILAVIAFGIYYTYVRIDRNRPINVEAYPNARLVGEETLGEGSDHIIYVYTASDNSQETVEQQARDMEAFYRERGFTCQGVLGRPAVGGVVPIEDIYLYSSCQLDRSHSLGLVQTVDLEIIPERTPPVHRNDDPRNEVIGGSELTGEIYIDVRRTWGNLGLLGG